MEEDLIERIRPSQASETKKISKIPSPLVSLIITITVNRVYLRFTSHYHYFQLRTQALIFRAQAQVFPILYRNLEPVELFTLSHAFQQDVTRNPGGIPACYKDVTGIPGKFLVVNLAGNTAKNYQESTKTPEGCYQEFLVKCKDVRGNYQDSLYLD
ncbi:hypothetical protein JOM56_014446 [Amanita muscaria]